MLRFLRSVKQEPQSETLERECTAPLLWGTCELGFITWALKENVRVHMRVSIHVDKGHGRTYKCRQGYSMPDGPTAPSTARWSHDPTPTVIGC